MARVTIRPNDLVLYQSSAAGSLGGAISSAEVSQNLNALFPDVSTVDSERGATDYRCVYLKNNSTATLPYARVYISTPTPNASSVCQLGIGVSAVNAVEPVTTQATAAPVGVTFQNTAKEARIDLGILPANATRAFWIQRRISPNAIKYVLDWVGLALDTVKFVDTP